MCRVAAGESLRQIARSYHTSHEAVRRVLSAARKELVASQGEPAALPPGGATAGVRLGERGAITVTRQMETNRERISAAGDCVETWHR